MSTSKSIDKICCIILVFVLLLTAAFANAEKFGVKAAEIPMGYEEKLFDTGKVHTIDIIMDDWDSFLETCENEEYEVCSAVIDKEAYKNIGIRAKGNTSLTSVASYGNNRYSFKIEFDHYDQSKTYYGLDKLSLNNIIQDNTYMKDYLSYQMMGYFGVNAPLCSYAYLKVNGEDWGLYLAVEGVEESFLERNYGSGYGQLYKPDSMNMGGGRGNGGGFDMDKFQEENGKTDSSQDASGSGNPQMPQPPTDGDGLPQDMPTMPQPSGNTEDESMPAMPQPPEGTEEGDMPTMPQPPEGTEEGDMPTMPQPPEGTEGGGMPAMPQPSEGTETTSDSNSKEAGSGPDKQAFPGGAAQPDGTGSQAPFGGGRGGKGMKSEDVSLIYTDDEYDSYQNIFENAKTDSTDSDKDRLIASIKAMNEGENIETVVNVDEVIRYFVVHNFVCNFDSYTGSMIHNYYLYEEDGQMYMVPWDYNLAFGGFQSQSDADALVNYPIDTPVSGGDVDSRPMLAWILNNEAYTEQYHQYFAEFITQYFDSGYFAQMIDSVSDMIAPYVEKDPTKFCTYGQFETGVATLKQFCLLRAESISGQLDGTIPSTSQGQEQDSSACIDASSITISDMGDMGKGMGRGHNTERDKIDIKSN